MQTVTVDLGLAIDSDLNSLHQPSYTNNPDHGEVLGQERGKNVFYFPGSNSHGLRLSRDGAALMCGDEFKISYHHTDGEGSVEPQLEIKTYPWGEEAVDRAQELLEEYREQVESYLLPEAVGIPEELDFDLD